MKLDDVFNHIGRPFTYYPKLAKALGGVNAALFTCLFAYWSGSESKKGWIYKTKNEIEEETGLSVGEQRTATKRLQELDVLKIKRIGIPAVNYYFFDWEKISVLIKKNLNENKNLKPRSVDLTHLDSDDVSDVDNGSTTQNKICKNTISRSVDLTHLDASKEHIYTRQNDTSISKSTAKSTTEETYVPPADLLPSADAPCPVNRAPVISVSDVEIILDFINRKTGKAYKAKRPDGNLTANAGYIKAILKSGYTVQDCKTVFARKFNEWGDSDKMAAYLTPETIYRKKNFDKYIAECTADNPLRKAQ